MIFTLKFICLFFIIAPTFAQTPSSGCDLITSEGKCFSYFTHSGINWSGARARCQTWGGDLASIDSASEDSALKSIKNNNLSGCYIGLNDIETNGVYVWSDGSNSTYRNWSPGEPNDPLTSQDNHDCGETDRINLGGNWNDEYCTTLRQCHYCSSRNIQLFGRIVQHSSTCEGLTNNTILSQDTTLYCITENRNTPQVNWSYVDLDGSRSVLSSTTDVTTGVSVLNVTTDKPGYYSCQVTRDNGASRTYTVGLFNLLQIGNSVQRLTSIQTETSSPTSILVSWSLLQNQTANSNETFSVYYSTGGVELLAGTTNSLTYNITDLTPNVNYAIRIEVTFLFLSSLMQTFSLQTSHFLKGFSTPNTVQGCPTSKTTEDSLTEAKTQTILNSTPNTVPSSSSFQFIPQINYTVVSFGILYFLTIILFICFLSIIIWCFKKALRKHHNLDYNGKGTKHLEARDIQEIPHTSSYENKCYSIPKVQPFKVDNPIYMEASDTHKET